MKPMTYKYFSRNGQVLPVDQAQVPLDDIAYSYGFGVYETLRVSNGILYFAEQHTKRLLASARAIDLEHNFSAEFVRDSITELLHENEVDSCNVKVLLVGGADAEAAQLYIQCLNPLFPDRKLYANGAHFITEKYVREYPQAKTLNMLPSYLAYRRARAADAYDGLLVDGDGCIREGTRTNFFVMQAKTLISPPESKILLGVMRQVVLKVAGENGYQTEERDSKNHR